MVIVIIGDKETTKQKVNKVLDVYFKTQKDFLVFTSDNKNINNLLFLLRHSRQPIFIITQIKILQKSIYSVLCSLVIGFILGLNLVEMAQVFKKNTAL